MNGAQAAEIIAEKTQEKWGDKLDDRYSKLDDSLERLYQDHVSAKPRTKAHLTFIAADLENLAKAFRKLDDDQILPPPPLSNEEEEDALAIWESEQVEAAHQQYENMAVIA